MTKAQSDTFNLKGCVPRCLIHLANAEGIPITKEIFCARYESYFTDQADNYGLLEGFNFRDVHLSLLPHLQLAGYDDYDAAVAIFQPNTFRTFMMSKINLDKGATDPKIHCSIITEMMPDRFSIWSPCQNGADAPEQFFRNDFQDDWVAKRARALVFRPVIP